MRKPTLTTTLTLAAALLLSCGRALASSEAANSCREAFVPDTFIVTLTPYTRPGPQPAPVTLNRRLLRFFGGDSPVKTEAATPLSLITSLDRRDSVTRRYSGSINKGLWKLKVGGRTSFVKNVGDNYGTKTLPNELQRALEMAELGLGPKVQILVDQNSNYYSVTNYIHGLNVKDLDMSSKRVISEKYVRGELLRALGVSGEATDEALKESYYELLIERKPQIIAELKRIRQVLADHNYNLGVDFQFMLHVSRQTPAVEIRLIDTNYTFGGDSGPNVVGLDQIIERFEHLN